jgi:hypothetical protein
MDRNPVGWFEIYVQDMPRARAFYESVFRVQLQPIGAPAGELEMWGFPSYMDRWGTSGSLVRMSGMPSGGNSTLVYFSCADCAEEAARVVPAGGRIVRDKMSIGQYGFVALASDTEGNMFGLHSLK